MNTRGRRARRPEGTKTSTFGAGRRESHDATEFYARFEVPETSQSEEIVALRDLPQGPSACIRADARALVLPNGEPLPANCVALVITSPPYFSGKEYERELGQGGVPGSYLEYLGLLRDVFAECKRVLEPGGRVAVNVANLGRKPFRSLASDVVRILQDDLRLLLRGEIIWRKGEGANGSCAWGSYRSAQNPVLRDTTERVVVACKGRFDRAIPPRERKRRGLPFESEIPPDEFMDATLDVWNIPPESAKRVQHPAPFPVELPERLIGLYSYVDDVVLDPFAGAGSTLVAAIRLGRRYLGYDTDSGYVETARKRVADELTGRTPSKSSSRAPKQRRPVHRTRSDLLRDAATRGKVIEAIAEEVLVDAGFTVRYRHRRVPEASVMVDLVARDADGGDWYFYVIGAFTATRNGLARTDTAWNAIGRAATIVRAGRGPVLLLTSDIPRRGTHADSALRAAGPEVVFDVIELLDPSDASRLAKYAKAPSKPKQEAGFWSDAELAKYR